ncbi:glycoside hydrolase [Pedobacter yulinensis]|uniref:Glycoside hydrolase n=1 Tax=Pedobacter yulinensis TaxID=2126353 RepID=A0A2T3HMF2_9SPHI|nr:family 43 glycosylhydrolase [Pedobacter yulinensis]PST83620.1 glycoside hydrolase [Pedobacter yulinensis]
MEVTQLNGNPVIRHTFTCDPTVIESGGRIYLYTGHDEAPEGSNVYVMNHWLCFSSADLLHWEEHPIPLRATDFEWASGDAYASKVIAYRDQYYWFLSVTNASGGKAIALAVADRPEGPFRDAIGAPLVDQQMIPDQDLELANLDPTVLVDDDGKIFLVWGNGVCYFARLRADLRSLDGPVSKLELPGFREGAHLHKRDGWYYLSYGYGQPERVAYCMSRSCEGPWAFKGILNEVAGNCETNRPAIIDFQGRSLFFYHNGALETGGSHRRSVCLDALHYNPDGTIQRVIMTSEGPRAFAPVPATQATS